MRNLPINNSEIDISIYCLSLMNKNICDFLKEGNRILKIGGKTIVAEINSRIENKVKFISAFKHSGFKLIKFKDIKSYFSIFTFKKVVDYKKIKINENDCGEILKPCLYKKR